MRAEASISTLFEARRWGAMHRGLRARLDIAGSDEGGRSRGRHYTLSRLTSRVKDVLPPPPHIILV